MPPIILTVLQGLFLLLLYMFVARAVRAVVMDVSPSTTRPRRPTPAPAANPMPNTKPRPKTQSRPQSGKRSDAPSRVAPKEIVVHGSSGAPRVIPLGEGPITFGRGEGATVTLGDPYTSDRHAKIYHDGKRWLISDMGSTNGTFLNQVKVTEPTPLAAGDQLGIGRTVVEVRK
jgi:hypothetical protein